MADTETPSTTIALGTISGEMESAPVNDNFSEIQTDFNTHTHPVTSDAIEGQWNTGDGTYKWRMVSGVKEDVEVASGEGDFTITFADDADQGDPSFTGSVRVTMTVGVTEQVAGDEYWSTANIFRPIGTAACFCIIRELNGATNSYTADVYWTAIGKVA